MEMTGPRSNTYKRFYDNVLLADDYLYGNGTWTWENCEDGGDKSPHAGEIWEVFYDRHRMPSSLLGSEDPDCSSSKRTAVQAEAVQEAYPNPFNSSVNVRYNLSEPGAVEVAIYSVTGQLVRRLVSEESALPGLTRWLGMDALSKVLK